ncbi:hypothetical protein GCM10009850_054580 [Nonomuraea monospora]|uniref:Uncharacterized protein n=1 Tax=Nonomuraea monospora TaxID=568818 RepID=A0ABN3CKJ2_9ACTN
MQPGLLKHLAPHSGLIVLTGLQPSARDGPQSPARRAAPLHEQKTVEGVENDRADTIYAHMTKITTG